MKIVWQVSDERLDDSPRTTIIPDDLLNECETQHQREMLINEYVLKEMRQIVSWNILDIEE